MLLENLTSAILSATEGDWIQVCIDGNVISDLARIGHTYWFEYHCWESPHSGDAEIWYRSHQQVQVLELVNLPFFGTLKERAEQGCLLVYKVRFPDGLEWDVFEDELMTSPKSFNRPDPPKRHPLS